jgi:hypothetical protein
MDLMRGSCDKEYHTIWVVDPHVCPKQAPRAVVLKVWAFEMEAVIRKTLYGKICIKVQEST